MVNAPSIAIDSICILYMYLRMYACMYVLYQSVCVYMCVCVCVCVLVFVCVYGREGVSACSHLRPFFLDRFAAQPIHID